MEKTIKQKSAWRRAFKPAFTASIPVLTGYTVLGMAYGILVATKGYGPLWTIAYSAFCFCGSMQFVAIPFMVGEFKPLYVFLLAVMVNARHMFYALSMLQKYKGSGKLKFFLIYWMSDETFAINSTAEVPDEIDAHKFYFWVSILDWLYWINGGLWGNVIGHMITINTTGLDFALTALFVVLFIEQLKTKRNAICGIIGVIASVISLIIFGAENLVVPAMILILASLLMGRKKLCD